LKELGDPATSSKWLPFGRVARRSPSETHVSKVCGEAK
jgi:hypothetical protein